MRNRAKCRLCKKVIESFHPTDYVECECGEISVDEGTCLRCSAKNWENFLRIDENDNEIVVSVKTDPSLMPKQEAMLISKPGRKEMLDALEEMIKAIDNLPEHARYAPVTHSDLSPLLSVILGLLRE